MDLSEKDRLIISNQLKILEKLYPEEADYYSTHRKAIEQGYKLHYNWLVEHFYDEMSQEECREVLDILEMYRAITFSYRRLTDKNGIDEKQIRFKGFDGNNEGKQFGYALYFIVDLKRYDELRYGVEYPDFNSGTPMLDRYKKMLKLWEGYSKSFELTREQIVELLKAK
jgi:uncharacterized protein YfbU (UPF0304 family)